jgi:hypothetical protein
MHTLCCLGVPAAAFELLTQAFAYLLPLLCNPLCQRQRAVNYIVLLQ